MDFSSHIRELRMHYPQHQLFSQCNSETQVKTTHSLLDNLIATHGSDCTLDDGNVSFMGSTKYHHMLVKKQFRLHLMLIRQTYGALKANFLNFPNVSAWWRVFVELHAPLLSSTFLNVPLTIVDDIITCFINDDHVEKKVCVDASSVTDEQLDQYFDLYFGNQNVYTVESFLHEHQIDTNDMLYTLVDWLTHLDAFISMRLMFTHHAFWIVPLETAVGSLNRISHNQENTFVKTHNNNNDDDEKENNDDTLSHFKSSTSPHVKFQLDPIFAFFVFLSNLKKFISSAKEKKMYATDPIRMQVLRNFRLDDFFNVISSHHLKKDKKSIHLLLQETWEDHLHVYQEFFDSFNDHAHFNYISQSIATFFMQCVTRNVFSIDDLPNLDKREFYHHLDTSPWILKIMREILHLPAHFDEINKIRKQYESIIKPNLTPCIATRPLLKNDTCPSLIRINNTQDHQPIYLYTLPNVIQDDMKWLFMCENIKFWYLMRHQSHFKHNQWFAYQVCNSSTPHPHDIAKNFSIAHNNIQSLNMNTHYPKHCLYFDNLLKIHPQLNVVLLKRSLKDLPIWSGICKAHLMQQDICFNYTFFKMYLSAQREIQNDVDSTNDTQFHESESIQHGSIIDNVNTWSSAFATMWCDKTTLNQLDVLQSLGYIQSMLDYDMHHINLEFSPLYYHNRDYHRYSFYHHSYYPCNKTFVSKNYNNTDNSENLVHDLQAVVPTLESFKSIDQIMNIIKNMSHVDISIDSYIAQKHTASITNDPSSSIGQTVSLSTLTSNVCQPLLNHPNTSSCSHRPCEKKNQPSTSTPWILPSPCVSPLSDNYFSSAGQKYSQLQNHATTLNTQSLIFACVKSYAHAMMSSILPNCEIAHKTCQRVGLSWRLWYMASRIVILSQQLSIINHVIVLLFKIDQFVALDNWINYLYRQSIMDNIHVTFSQHFDILVHFPFLQGQLMQTFILMNALSRPGAKCHLYYPSLTTKRPYTPIKTQLYLRMLHNYEKFINKCYSLTPLDTIHLRRQLIHFCKLAQLNMTVLVPVIQKHHLKIHEEHFKNKKIKKNDVLVMDDQQMNITHSTRAYLEQYLRITIDDYPRYYHAWQYCIFELKRVEEVMYLLMLPKLWRYFSIDHASNYKDINVDMKDLLNVEYQNLRTRDLNQTQKSKTTCKLPPIYQNRMVVQFIIHLELQLYRRAVTNVHGIVEKKFEHEIQEMQMPTHYRQNRFFDFFEESIKTKKENIFNQWSSINQTKTCVLSPDFDCTHYPKYHVYNKTFSPMPFWKYATRTHHISSHSVNNFPWIKNLHATHYKSISMFNAEKKLISGLCLQQSLVFLNQIAAQMDDLLDHASLLDTSCMISMKFALGYDHLYKTESYDIISNKTMLDPYIDYFGTLFSKLIIQLLQFENIRDYRTLSQIINHMHATPMSKTFAKLRECLEKNTCDLLDDSRLLSTHDNITSNDQIHIHTVDTNDCKLKNTEHTNVQKDKSQPIHINPVKNQTCDRKKDNEYTMQTHAMFPRHKTCIFNPTKFTQVMCNKFFTHATENIVCQKNACFCHVNDLSQYTSSSHLLAMDIHHPCTITQHQSPKPNWIYLHRHAKHLNTHQSVLWCLTTQSGKHVDDKNFVTNHPPHVCITEWLHLDVHLKNWFIQKKNYRFQSAHNLKKQHPIVLSPHLKYNGDEDVKIESMHERISEVNISPRITPFSTFLDAFMSSSNQSNRHYTIDDKKNDGDNTVESDLITEQTCDVLSSSVSTSDYLSLSDFDSSISSTRTSSCESSCSDDVCDTERSKLPDNLNDCIRQSYQFMSKIIQIYNEFFQTHVYDKRTEIDQMLTYLLVEYEHVHVKKTHMYMDTFDQVSDFWLHLMLKTNSFIRHITSSDHVMTWPIFKCAKKLDTPLELINRQRWCKMEPLSPHTHPENSPMHYFSTRKKILDAIHQFDDCHGHMETNTSACPSVVIGHDHQDANVFDNFDKKWYLKTSHTTCVDTLDKPLSSYQVYAYNDVQDVHYDNMTCRMYAKRDRMTIDIHIGLFDDKTTHRIHNNQTRHHSTPLVVLFGTHANGRNVNDDKSLSIDHQNNTTNIDERSDTDDSIDDMTWKMKDNVDDQDPCTSINNANSSQTFVPKVLCDIHSLDSPCLQKKIHPSMPFGLFKYNLENQLAFCIVNADRVFQPKVVGWIHYTLEFNHRPQGKPWHLTSDQLSDAHVVIGLTTSNDFSLIADEINLPSPLPYNDYNNVMVDNLSCSSRLYKRWCASMTETDFSSTVQDEEYRKRLEKNTQVRYQVGLNLTTGKIHIKTPSKSHVNVYCMPLCGFDQVDIYMFITNVGKVFYQINGIYYALVDVFDTKDVPCSIHGYAQIHNTNLRLSTQTNIQHAHSSSTSSSIYIDKTPIAHSKQKTEKSTSTLNHYNPYDIDLNRIQSQPIYTAFTQRLYKITNRIHAHLKQKLRSRYLYTPNFYNPFSQQIYAALHILRDICLPQHMYFHLNPYLDTQHCDVSKHNLKHWQCVFGHLESYWRKIK